MDTLLETDKRIIPNKKNAIFEILLEEYWSRTEILVLNFIFIIYIYIFGKVLAIFIIEPELNL